MKDRTSIKCFDIRFKKLKNYWWKPVCTRCNRHIAIDTYQEPDKESLKKAGLPKNYRITLCKNCRIELEIRRFFDPK